MSASLSGWVGIDIGGTAIKGGRISEDGTVQANAEVPTQAGSGTAAVLDRIGALARELCGSNSVMGIGIGIPGLIEQQGGLVRESPNLSELEGIRVQSELAQRLNCSPERIVVDNDANAAALGEQWLGAARGEDNVLVATLGTGIGGGLVLDGKLFHGAGFASEFGHVVIEPRGLPCPCGSSGCIEQYASATAARRRAVELGLPEQAPGDLVLLAERARSGHPAENQLLFKIGRDLGRAFGAVVSLLDVRCLVVAGGFSAAFDTMETGILAGALEKSFIARKVNLRALRAQLGNRAGWIGAARASMH